MHPLTFIARHINADIPTVECDAICAITGEKITKGVRVDKAFGDLFTDYDCVRYASGFVSPDFIKCTGKTLDGGRSSMRNFSYVCTEKELRRLKRDDVLEIIMNPPEPPFIIAYSFNNKKHTTFKAKLNYTTDIISITTDTIGIIDIDLNLLKEIYPIVQGWLSRTKDMKKDTTFFSKTEILQGSDNIEKITKYGYDKFIKENKFLDKYRKTNFLTLIVRLLNIKELN